MRYSLSKLAVRRHLIPCGIVLLALAPMELAGAPPPEPSAPAFAQEREPIRPIPNPAPADGRKLALGAMLFTDTRLSADNSRSCQSCHDIGTNGATGRRFDEALDGAPLRPNTPTVFNAALSFRLNWRGDSRSLEAQAETTIENPQTMGQDMAGAVRKLAADPAMVQQFRDAYGHAPDRASLLDAIAVYERSLVTPGSAFDRWLEGDTKALSADELQGYALFKSLGCISCHQGVNVGGNLFERSGVFARLTGGSRGIFRVPSLRNIATTAPYFHDGSSTTLDDAVKRMAVAQLDQPLTDDKAAQIVAFLRTLTGRYQGRPLGAPSP